MTDAFPRSGVANDFFVAARFEGEVIDCEVLGTIPEDLCGTFYRLGGDWLYPPKFPDDSPFNADGYVSMFRFAGGRVDYRGRFVQTERYQAQRSAKRQLFGRYRNPRTDDVPGLVRNRTVANTTPFIFNGQLLACKEDSLPFLIDPHTLETLGEFDFAGAYTSSTFTAHPKVDPATGEAIVLGYEEEGEASNCVHLTSIAADGNIAWRMVLKMPYVSMLHDYAITPNYVVLPVYGLVTSKERLEEGRVHWGWQPGAPTHIAVIPRGGEVSDVRYFSGPSRAIVHVLNAFEEGGKIILDAPISNGNPFPFFPAVDGSPFDPSGGRTTIRRITLDLADGMTDWSEEDLFPNAPGYLGRIDERFFGVKHRVAFMEFADGAKPFSDRAGHRPPSVSNCYGRFDVVERTMSHYFAGDCGALQECCFVPRAPTAAEGDGYLIGVYSNFAERRSELLILDAALGSEAELARVLLPFRLSSQVHGAWASHQDVPF